MIARSVTRLLLTVVMSVVAIATSTHSSSPLRKCSQDARSPADVGSNKKGLLTAIAAEIRAVGIDRDFESFAAMTKTPVVRRMLDVEDAWAGEYYLVELEDSHGGFLGLVAISKNGKLRGAWPYQGAALPPRVHDLEPVCKALTIRFGAGRCHYYLSMNNISGDHQYLPLIAAEGPAGRHFVNYKLEIYHEVSFVKGTPPGKAAGPADLSLKAPAGLFQMTKGGHSGVLRLMGRLNEEDVRP